MKIKPGAVFTFISLLVLLFLLILASVPRVSDFMSKTSVVNANILVVEGWLPQNIIDLAYTEYVSGNYERIITNGLSVPEYYPVVMNGDLVFYIKKFQSLIGKSDSHYLEADLYSEMGGKHRAHFNFYVNDSLITDFYADMKKKKYRIYWKGQASAIDSVIIQFDNDDLGEFGDHNLYVKGLIIDGQIAVSYMQNSVYNRTARGWEKRIKNNYSTYADRARNHLIELGIDSAKVTSIPGEASKINRTLLSALAFRDWLKSSGFKITGINLASDGTHALRTWMTYKKVLGKSVPVGIISFRDKNEGNNNLLKTIKDLLESAYYWIILLPY